MVTLKVAHNKGNARVWLDRASCRDLGLTHGAKYVLRFQSDCIELAFRPKSGERVRRVAGTPDRPVIDICSRKVTALLTSTHYSAVRTPTRVTITGA